MKQPVVVRVERQPWTMAEAAAFLQTARHDRYWPAYLLGIIPGLRQGEILGLSWGDIDFDALTVRIDVQLQRRAGKYVRVPTKGKKGSSRSIPPEIAATLREHRTAQLAERLAARKPTEDGLVFVTPRGLPVNGSWLTHHFERLSRDAGVRVIPFHALRNAAGSYYAALGIHPNVTAAQFGHADPTTAMRHYTHVVDEQQRDAARRIADALGLGGSRGGTDAASEG